MIAVQAVRATASGSAPAAVSAAPCLRATTIAYTLKASTSAVAWRIVASAGLYVKTGGRALGPRACRCQLAIQVG
ncbi:hypothetical protein [Streptomyces sp. TLI_146]|uniref:hypothetical protein n=1 Tax=Streptomyces sp. TLI_146 TaxID=1938858 RepID=UPI00117FEB07|nr:hypothetical protein [Streptomyces sp. TLI_146]